MEVVGTKKFNIKIIELTKKYPNNKFILLNSLKIELENRLETNFPI